MHAMESRLERNRRYRKRKRFFKLFVLSIVILLMLSLYQINRSFHQLVGESSHLLALNDSEYSIRITILGRDIEISKNSIQQGAEFIREAPHKIFDGFYYLLEKVSNR